MKWALLEAFTLHAVLIVVAVNLPARIVRVVTVGAQAPTAHTPLAFALNHVKSAILVGSALVILPGRVLVRPSHRMYS